IVLALAAAGVVAVQTAAPAISANLVADYQFQNSHTSSVGTPPDLTDIGGLANSFATETPDGVSRTVLDWPATEGLALPNTSGVIPNDHYTVVMLLRLQETDGYRRLLDFKNGTDDNGFYNLFTREGLYPNPAGPTGAMPTDQWVQVAFTRDNSGTVAAYADGVQQFTLTDTAQDAVIDANNVLRFFLDNTSGASTTENADGAVARIRLYDDAL